MAVLNYVELPVGSVEREVEFYRSAFGWNFTSYGPDYASWEEGPCQLALSGVALGQTAAALPVIQADDIEAARDAVIAAGGTILREIFAYPGGRRFHFADPAGLELAVYRPG